MINQTLLHREVVLILRLQSFDVCITLLTGNQKNNPTAYPVGCDKCTVSTYRLSILYYFEDPLEGDSTLHIHCLVCNLQSSQWVSVWYITEIAGIVGKNQSMIFNCVYVGTGCLLRAPTRASREWEVCKLQSNSSLELLALVIEWLCIELHRLPRRTFLPCNLQTNIWRYSLREAPLRPNNSCFYFLV